MTFDKITCFTTIEDMLTGPIMQIMNDFITKLSLALSNPLKASCIIYIALQHSRFLKAQAPMRTS